MQPSWDNGKVALVTGACGDIGAAIVERFVSRGMQVVASDVLAPEAAEEKLAGIGPKASLLYCQADIRNREQVAAVVAATRDRFGKLDLCVGNAGIVVPAPFLELSASDWQRQLDINLTGNFHLGQEVASAMVRQGAGGRIVFTGSWVQDVPSRDIAAYCSSKGGLKMLVKCMALELAAHRINVNLVAPGFVNAGLSGQLAREDPSLVDKCLQVTPLGYLMSPAQVAEAVLFLCSPGAEYMTGSTLLVDGGNSLFRRD